MAKKITLAKSLIGSKKDQIATAHSLGLKKPSDVTVQPESPFSPTTPRHRARSTK